MNNKRHISIIGGSGHVGFPLGLIFSSKGFKVSLIDRHKVNNEKINSGQTPFLEENSHKLLKDMLRKKRIHATSQLNEVRRSKYIIVCIGTPITRKLNPSLKNFFNFFRQLNKLLKKDQIVIIRSSVYPGICNKVYKIIKNKCKNLSYCPERIVQGKAITELPKLSQLIAGKNNIAKKESGKLFNKICKKIIYTEIIEAELSKLFSNAYRYINFSISNEFFMICKNYGQDFHKIREIMRQDYKRNSNIPKAGFAAGPCLLKDTMQLSSFYSHKFLLGHSAMSINEGLPKFLISKLSEKHNLKKKIIGILGLTFKAETDDIRDSLSIKLINLLKKRKLKTLQSDEYYFDKDSSVDKKYLIKKSDIIIIGAPHKAYKNIRFPKNKVVVDIWGVVEKY